MELERGKQAGLTMPQKETISEAVSIACNALLEQMAALKQGVDPVFGLLGELSEKGVSIPHSEHNLAKVSSLDQFPLPEVFRKPGELLVYRPFTHGVSELTFSELTEAIKTHWNFGDEEVLVITRAGDAALLINEDGGITYYASLTAYPFKNPFTDLRVP